MLGIVSDRMGLLLALILREFLSPCGNSGGSLVSPRVALLCGVSRPAPGTAIFLGVSLLLGFEQEATEETRR